MPSFLVPTLIHKQDCKNGHVPPILPHAVVSVAMTRRLGDAPLPSTLMVSFVMTIDGMQQGIEYSTQSWPIVCTVDCANIPAGVHALSCAILSDDTLYQPFAVPIIVGAVQAPDLVPVCPGYQLQGVRRNEGAEPAWINVGSL